MHSREVRNSFLDFFGKKGHKILHSAPVIPQQDPTLLFTNAGMNQFKDIFIGAGKREYNRAVNSQKCIRVSGKHNDLEEVGVDTYHHTFFEMLGNWSFGDYYKREAIQWAWELFTEVWKLDADKLYATVYLEDEESEKLWYEMTNIEQGRVYKFGKSENFWEMGETGPCGPCSEIHYDLGAEYSCGSKCSFGCECGRYQELWNLVFIQFNRENDGKLTELPAKHVDTGMGFERITAILQGKRSNYDTDLFERLIESISEITGLSYTEENDVGVAFRVICDHIRALTFALADGAAPSNEGRGYVLRRILRRAARYSRDLNIHDPFMFRLVKPLIETMGADYPEIVEREEYIRNVIQSEEVGFGKTLDRGIELFQKIAENVQKSGLKTIPGHDAFMLYDTYGFPLDLTELMARDLNLDVNIDEFDSDMAGQKERSSVKKSGVSVKTFEKSDVVTVFNYNKESFSTKIAGIFDSNGKKTDSAVSGQEVTILLDGETPFYSESGGQVGDTGRLETPDGKILAEIYDTQKSEESSIYHYAKVINSTLKPGITVNAAIDSQRRLDIKRNHTATHLLHTVLREVLGTHVKQAGSLVAPTHLRFDFNHFHKLSDEEIAKVEKSVNDAIRRNYPVILEENVPLEEAKNKGAMALFGEKYGDRVRTVSIADYSIELCGGTHIESTGLIGEFRITSESASAAGIRRIEAETGNYTYERIKQERNRLKHIKEKLNAQDEDIIEKLEHLLSEHKELEKNLRELRRSSVNSELETIINKARKENSSLITKQFQSSTMDELKEYGDFIRKKMPEGAALIGTESNGKVLLVCIVGDELLKEKMWDANAIISELTKSVGGGGGGRKHMATAGIKGLSKINDVFDVFKNVTELLYGSTNVSN